MKKILLMACFAVFCNISAKNQTKKAIVIGASSGMGRQVAKLIAQEYEVGLASRRLNLLESLQKEIPTKTYIKQIDVSKLEEAKTKLAELIEEMGGLDLILISVSSCIDTEFTKSWETDKKILDVDLAGFLVMADVAVNFFEKQNSGHLIGISSIDGLRGNALCPVYSGAKAFVSTYLEGIRNYMIQNKIPVYVTDIIPGWVDNEKIEFSKQEGTYWVTSTKKASEQIFNAIKNKKKKAYITKRWQIIAWLQALLPDCIYNGIGGL